MPSNDLSPFAWAGVLLDLPRELRPLKVQGTARRGMIALADDDGHRLDIAWAKVFSRRFDANRSLRRKLFASLTRFDRPRAVVESVNSQTLVPLLRCRLETQTRWIGFAPDTRRAIELVYHHRDGLTDKRYDQLLPLLTDQPTGAPQRWAFFGHRITTPADFELFAAKLNLGNMQVRLIRQGRFGSARLSIRLLYPATLALQRNTLADWFNTLILASHSSYSLRYTRRFRRGAVVHDAMDTPLGPALVGDAKLPWIVRVVRATTPAVQRSWLVHDREHNHLVFVQLADRRARLDPTMTQIIQGLHWRKT